jgi:putative membrane protein
MMTRKIWAGSAALAAAALFLVPVAQAADGSDADSDVQVVNTETLQVYVTSDGDVQSKRVYEQLALTGHGPISFKNPVGSSGVRNIDGFGGLSVQDGEQTVDTTVDGTKRLRSVTNYEGDLPLEISIKYVLDGKTIDPDDLVGADGELEVTYTVKNATAKQETISYPDGKGGTKTETVEVPVPIVGQMEAALPPSFTEVSSPQANLAGDGQGGTRAAFTMTLFPPLGADTMTFSYKARVSDAVVPPTSVTALPINPLENPTFKTAGESYKSGADTGLQLANGATLINDNLLRLRDGAGKLVQGLIQLHDGSQQLSGGLDQLDGGVGELSSGAEQLAAGQRSLTDGLTKLYNGVDGLPANVKGALKKNKDYLKLLGALTNIADGVGHLDDPATKKTLLGGMNAIAEGLDYPGANDCLVAASGGVPVKCGVVDALSIMIGLLQSTAASADVEGLKPELTSLWAANSCAVPLATGLTGLGGTCQDIATVYDSLYRVPGSGQSLLFGGVQFKLGAAASSLGDVATKLQDQLLAPGAGLDQLRAGLSNPQALKDCSKALDTGTTADDCGIREGSLYLRDTGIPLLVDGIAANVRTQLLAGIGVPTKGCDPKKTLRCGAAALADGGDQLVAGVDQLVAGVTLLDDGGGQLADGLGEARDGAPKLEDGASRLSKEGMVKLIKAGKDTTQQYGKLYATIEAGAKRGEQEKMLFGAPSDANGLTAYSYELLGDDGNGSRNLQRGLGALGLLGLSWGGLALRRRLI